MTTNCSQLKMFAPDGKTRLRDVVDTEGIFRKEKPIGLDENRKVAKRGGLVAKKTKEFYEEVTNIAAITKNNNLNYKYKEEKLELKK